ncbi:MAG: hypothetical protein QXD82_04505 [Nitrososphaerales archaeon]
MKRRITAFLLLFMILSIPLFIPLIAYAAPSSEIYFEDGTDEEDNVLLLGDEDTVVITFKNSADSTLDDVASTIQNITLAAANLNPSRVSIDLEADWVIYDPNNSPRTSGTVTGSKESGFYSPYSTTITVDIYIWKILELNAYTDSSQFTDTLKVLRPQEYVNLTITIICNGLVGDSRIWFFFRATEYSTSLPITDIGTIPEDQRMNLYYSKAPGPIQTPYWWPLHNSYDPYDEDIGTGHSFNQHSWTRVQTIRSFSKANKMVHQKPDEYPPAEISFHICGEKFNDLNRNGIRDEGEPGINDVEITLLGADMITPAEEYYSNMFIYPSPEDNPLYSGENELQGSYCFNLEDVDPEGGVDGEGTYIFYIKETLPEGRIATTPTIIGPITLVASEDGPRESLYNDFGNALPSQIGGTLIPINDMNIGSLTSLALLALIASVTISIIIAKRRRFFA